MSDNRNTGAPTLIGLLGLLFLGLKLAHVITWSWWLVTLPFYGALGLFVAGSVVILLSAGDADAVAKARSNPAVGSGRRVSISDRRDSR